MPELRLKEVRLPELRLPEMTRDDNARAIGDARRDVSLDRVDLTRLDPRRMDLNDVRLPRGPLPRNLDLSKVELPKVIVDAGVATGLMQRRRSRWPYIVGLVFGLALLGAALAQLPMIRDRLAELRRRRATEGMYGGGAPLDAGPRAFDPPVAVPIEPSAYADPVAVAGSPYDDATPLSEDFGSDLADERPMTEGETAPRS